MIFNMNSDLDGVTVNYYINIYIKYHFVIQYIHTHTYTAE